VLDEGEFLDFVYIGAPRAGSTWLAATLMEHQEVWVPYSKEIHFFSERMPYTFEHRYSKGIDYYRDYFKEAPKNTKLGELSPFYYYDLNAAHRIYKHFPNVRIIAMLRNPLDVLYSLYLLLRNRERRENTFEKEIAKHPDLIDLGFYHRHLTPYFDWFPKENIFVGIYEDFFKDENQGCRELFKFLGIDEELKSQVLGKRVNASVSDRPLIAPYVRGTVLSMLNTKPFTPIKKFLLNFKMSKKTIYKTVAKNNKKPSPGSLIAPSMRGMLMEQYAPDIRRLEGLLEMNLDIWRENKDVD